MAAGGRADEAGRAAVESEPTRGRRLEGFDEDDVGESEIRSGDCRAEAFAGYMDLVRPGSRICYADVADLG